MLQPVAITAHVEVLAAEDQAVQDGSGDGFITQEANGIRVDPSSIFDVQVKRLHAYKRQLLNALHIIDLYHEILNNPRIKMHPRTFIFAAKAAPGYTYAKSIIKLINSLADQINNDKRVNELIRVVFLENYNVTLAEKIVPAAEVSEQISTTTKGACSVYVPSTGAAGAPAWR